MRVDPDLERIADRLTSAELRAETSDTEDLFEDGVRPFVDVYSSAGLRTVMREFHLDKALKAMGLGDYDIRISRDDEFRHRLEIVLADGAPIMDMRLHLQEATVDGALDRPVAVVVVDWLLMQHPRRSFTEKRPRFPGQTHPGTGLGRQIHALLILLCRRLGRDGLVSVPERFHLAALYRRIGYVAADPDSSVGIIAALAAGDDANISLVALAWAVERGFVVDDRGAPWGYTPHTLVLAVSPRLEHALATSKASSPPSLPIPSLHIDTEGLEASLAADPVDGLTTIWR